MFRSRCFSRRCLAVLAVFCTLIPGYVHASENQFFSGILEFGDLLIPEKTHVTVGLGPVLRPDYIGSDNYEIAAEPALFLRFEGLLTLQNDGLAINLLGVDDIEFGPTARLTRGRNENENSDLAGLGDVGLSFDIGLYAKATFEDKYNIRLRYTHAVINNSNGGLLDVRLSTILYRKNKISLAAALEGDWITSGRAQRFFGVTAQQSVRANKPMFEPGSGFRDVNLDFAAQWQFAQKWSVNGFARYMRLIGDAANSPIVGDPVGSPNQFILGAFVAYKFSFSLGSD